MALIERFNPLGNFNPMAHVDHSVVAMAKEFHDSLPSVHVDRDLSRIYGHWSAVRPDISFPEYNAMVLYKDGHYRLEITHTPLDNAVSTFSELNYAKHTYKRNDGSFGICLGGMDGATPFNLGPDPETVAGLTVLCAGIGAVALKYDIDISGISDGGPTGSFAGEPNFSTHSEAAHRSGKPALYEPYFWTDTPSDGDTRGDLSTFAPLPADVPMQFAFAVICGNALRELSHTYKVAVSLLK